MIGHCVDTREVLLHIHCVPPLLIVSQYAKLYIAYQDPTDFAVWMLVLDVGSACGHFAHWLHTYYSVCVLGIDINARAVDYANTSSGGANKCCVGDAANLNGIPNQTFHGVYSYAILPPPFYKLCPCPSYTRVQAFF